MKYNVDMKELILSLKRVRNERGLSVDEITDIVTEADPTTAPSRSSIARVFADGSENDASHFRFEATLKPICNALLDIETDEQSDSADDLAYKSLIRFKKDIIEDYAQQNKTLKEEVETIKDKEKLKYAAKLDKETQHFNDSIAFMTRQIQLKDQRIDELMNMNRELMQTNNTLIKQLMNCPLRKEED